MGNKYGCDILALDDYDYSPWFEELDDKPSMPPLNGDEEEVKGRERIKNLNSKQTINQTWKAGNNSNKLKSKIRQIFIFCIIKIEPPKHFTKL